MKIAQLIQAAAVAALFASGAASAATPIITNGNFESYTVGVSGGGYTMVAAGSNAITGWTVGGTSVDLIKNSYGSVGSGTSVDMLGTPGPGSLSQLFNYAANTTYTLTFDLSLNPGAGGNFTGVDVFVNNLHTGFTGTNPSSPYSLTFTTGNTAGSQWLIFSSVGGDVYSGAVLAYAWSAESLTRYGNLVTLGIACAMIFFHLITIKPHHPRRFLITATVMLLAGAGLMVMANLQSNGRAADELYMSVLLPPEVRRSQDRSIDQFMANAGKLKSDIDAARTRAVKPGAAETDDDDDGSD